MGGNYFIDCVRYYNTRKGGEPIHLGQEDHKKSLPVGRKNIKNIIVREYGIYTKIEQQ